MRGYVSRSYVPRYYEIAAGLARPSSSCQCVTYPCPCAESPEAPGPARPWASSSMPPASVASPTNTVRPWGIMLAAAALLAIFG